MRLSRLIRLPTHACALFLVPFLACAFVTPAVAETSPQPSTQYNGDLPSAAAKPIEAAEQPKSESPAAKPDTKPEAAQSETRPEPVQAGSEILINIDKSTQQMTVFVDGMEKYTWPVSTGKRGYSTPSGNYSATSMNEIWYSKEWDNAPMPHAIFYMKDGHAIHGSYEVKNLGKPASHGCVRISPKNAATLFTLVKANGMENTKVVLAGITPGGEAKVASQPAPRYRDADAGPWDNAPRGFFGWQRGPAWDGPAYAPPPRYYREQRRGWFQRPRGYY
jgi:lipoprotein-anchoring transpeptidase ErfK/SrfK